MKRRDLILILVICCAAYLPFIGKGVTNDDLVFLDYAKRLTKNPFVCVVDDYTFLGQELKDLVVFESTHPPFVPYYLKAVMKLVGENLNLLHLAYLPFLLAATLALGWLLTRYTHHGPLPALAVTLGPLFLPNATSLMTDVPLFAFWFTAMALWERALSENSWRSRWHWGAALCAVCALFTAYQGLGLLVVMAIQAFYRERFRDALIWCGAVLACLLVWVFGVYVQYQILPYFSPPREEVNISNEINKGLVWENIWIKARVTVLYLGTALLFFTARPFFKRPLVILLAAGWGLAITAYLFPGSALWQSVQAWVLLTSGLLGLGALLPRLRECIDGDREARRVNLVLLACVSGFVLFQVFLTSFAAPRYILIPMGALLLLILRQDDESQAKTPWLALGASLILGLLVATAEWDYSRAQRIDRLDLPGESTVYFLGEKGMQYHGERAGYHYLLPKDSHKVFYLLKPTEIDHAPMPESLRKGAEEIANFPVAATLPMRVMNRASNAGFYIHTRGLLPFTFSREPLETFTLYRVFQPGLRDWRERDYVSKPAGEILPEYPVSQDFLCPSDGLTRFQLMLATHNRRNTSSLVVTLYRLENGEPGELVFREVLDTSTLVDNAWRTFEMEPIPSEGNYFRLELSSPDATSGNAVNIWTNANAEGIYRYGDKEREGALGFEALCAPGLVN